MHIIILNYGDGMDQIANLSEKNEWKHLNFSVNVYKIQ